MVDVVAGQNQTATTSGGRGSGEGSGHEEVLAVSGRETRRRSAPGGEKLRERKTKKKPSSTQLSRIAYDDISSLGSNYEETPLPFTVPHFGLGGKRSRANHTPFKVGMRLSLSGKKTRTSPRKSIWGKDKAGSMGRLAAGRGRGGGKGGASRGGKLVSGDGDSTVHSRGVPVRYST